MGDAFDVEAFGDVIARFELEQVLQLEKSEILIAKPDVTVGIDQYIGPLAKKSAKLQPWNCTLNWLANVLTDRIEGRHRTVEFRQHVPDSARE